MANRYKASIFSSTAATSTTSAASGVWKLSDIAQAITAGLWPIVAAAGDALFNYVSLLMPFNNTNGKTNNTFLDSSTNRFTITRTGTPTQGTFTPFSQTGWGGVFVGVTDALTQQTPNAVYGYGTGDFTIEFWVFPNLLSGQTFVSNLASAASVAPHIYYATAAGGSIRYFTNSADRITGTALSIGTWYHIAVSRTSGSTKMFINGTQAGSTYTDSNNYGTSNPLGIGDYGIPLTGASTLNGYMSNVRIVKGVGVYTGTFTPPAVPLAITQSAGTNISAITGTQTSILTLQSNRFNDQTAANQPLTLAGTPSIQAFSPFLPTAAYDSGGTTGFFNGTTDYLSVPDNAALEFGTNSITLECWFYMTGTSGYLLDKNNSGSGAAPGFSLYVSTTSVIWYYDAANNGQVISSISTTVVKNQWNHIALVRSVSGTTANAVFLNGARVGTSATATAFPNNTQNFRIGATFLSSSVYQPITGFVSNVRVVNGTAVYDPSLTTLTVPTAPLTAITNTALLTLQSNYFKDNSANAFTITLSGTPSIQTFNPFSQAGWSGYIGGGSNYLTVANNAILALGSGDFTIELWVYANSVSSVQALVSTGNGSLAQPYCYLNSAIPTFLYNSVNVATGPTVVANTWTHVAFVRSGSTITVYTNGVAGAAASPYTDTFTTSGTYIGTSSAATQILSGYLSNVRIVTGTAVYTANFTPPTSPLTAITNTTLLTLQSNYFKDNSTNAFAITVAGTPSIQAFSPFLYDSATNGGAVYFNGTTDYVSAPDNAALELSSSDFTIEAWIYPTADQLAVIVCKRASNVGNGPYTFSYALTTKVLSLIASADNTTTAVTVTGIAVTFNTWQHVAATRSGTNWTVWQNGVSTGTASYAGTIYDTGTSLTTIGAFGNGANLFPGYISNLRIVKGAAVYTAAFTPPTAPLTANANTSLLLSGINAGAIDEASKNTAITNSSAQISTTISKWGGSSLFCSLAADKLTIPDSPVLRFGTGDFTIEGWFYLNSASALRNIVSKGNTTTTGWTIGIDSINRIFATYTSTTLTGTTTLSASTWYYFAMVRSGTATGNIKLYINGTLEATSATAITTDFNQTDALYIGSNRTGTTPAFNGYLDDIRITKAARTVTTTPTAAFFLQ